MRVLFEHVFRKWLMVVFLLFVINFAVVGWMWYNMYRWNLLLSRLESEVAKVEDSRATSLSLPIKIENSYQITMDYQVDVGKFVVTGYSPKAGGINCSGNCDVTAIGMRVSAVEGVDGITYCAVDPDVIPLGSILVIQGLTQPCIAVDTGGAIKGNHIDYLFHDLRDAIKWGKREKMVVILKNK